MTYEQSIIATAERHGWIATREGGFVRVDNGRYWVRHRLGGQSARAYHERTWQDQSRCRGDKP